MTIWWLFLLWSSVLLSGARVSCLTTDGLQLVNENNNIVTGLDEAHDRNRRWENIYVPIYIRDYWIDYLFHSFIYSLTWFLFTLSYNYVHLRTYSLTHLSDFFLVYFLLFITFSLIYDNNRCHTSDVAILASSSSTVKSSNRNVKNKDSLDSRNSAFSMVDTHSLTHSCIYSLINL